MDILFLGTAAYEGYPNPFCEGCNCKKAREKSAVSFRLTSAAMLNGDLLIDFGPNIMAGAHKTNTSLFNVKTLLVTHSHSDHLYPPNFGYRKTPYNRSYDRLPVMTVLSNAVVLERITGTPYYDPEKTILREAIPFEKLTINGYEITPVPAVHRVAEGEIPLLYVIEKGGTSFFYASDTGPMTFQDIERIAKLRKKPIDVLALDATMGFIENSEFPFHHSYEQFLETVEAMRSAGLLDENSKVYAHHFSHSANPSHETLLERYGEHAIGVTHDGLKIEI